MDYMLKAKNKDDKWWIYGNVKKNQWGNNQASFKIDALKELIEIAEAKGTEWINLSLYENKPNEAQEKHTQDKGNAYVPEPELDDEIPF